MQAVSPLSGVVKEVWGNGTFLSIITTTTTTSAAAAQQQTNSVCLSLMSVRSILRDYAETLSDWSQVNCEGTRALALAANSVNFVSGLARASRTALKFTVKCVCEQPDWIIYTSEISKRHPVSCGWELWLPGILGLPGYKQAPRSTGGSHHNTRGTGDVRSCFCSSCFWLVLGEEICLRQNVVERHAGGGGAGAGAGTCLSHHQTWRMYLQQRRFHLWLQVRLCMCREKPTWNIAY